MNACGMVSERESSAWPFLTPFLPACQFYEVHQSRPIQADTRDIIAAVTACDIRADRVGNFLLSVRELPARLLNKLRPRAHAETARGFGLHSFTLLQRDDYSLSYGLVGRFWRPDFGLQTIFDAAAFQAHRDTGNARLVLRFVAVRAASGHVLKTETFVYCPSAPVHLLFTPYWLVIRLASGWIRRRTLQSIEAALRQAASPSPPPCLDQCVLLLRAR